MIFEAKLLYEMDASRTFRRQSNSVSSAFFRTFFLSLCPWFYLVIALCFAEAGYSQEANNPKECLYLSEIMYNPTGDDSLLEFVEICNKCNSYISLSGVTLRGVSYTFDDGSYANPLSSVIVPKSCFNEGDFCSQNPALIDNSFCCFSGTLTNTFKTIDLVYDSIVFDSFSYTANSKENYSIQRFSNYTEFSLAYGSPGICYFSEPVLENSSNNGTEEGAEDDDGSVIGDDFYDEYEWGTEDNIGNLTGNLSDQTGGQTGGQTSSQTSDQTSDQTSEYSNLPLNLTNTTDSINDTGLFNTTNLSNTSNPGDVSNLSGTAILTNTTDIANLTNLINLTNTTDITNLTNATNLTDTTDITNLSNSTEGYNTSNGSFEEQMINASNESQTGENASQTSMNQTSTNQTGINQTNTNQTDMSQTNTNQTGMSQTSTSQTSTSQTSTSQTSTSQTSTNQTIPNESCFEARISIDAPLLINESSTSYTISVEAPKGCSYYYHYEVLDLCGNVIRELRESTVFGRKSFTPTSDCCAYRINAYLFENTNLSLNAILVDNATKYMIKPSSCEESRDTAVETRLFESGGKINFGLDISEPLSADEQIEKVSFTLKARRENLKSLQTFFKGNVDVTSDFSRLVLGLDKDIFCKVDPRIYSLELSGKINSESFADEIDVDCSDYLDGSNDDSNDNDDTISETPSNSSSESKSDSVTSEMGIVDDMLKSLVDIKSFYTLKKNFSENISLYFNVDYNQSLLGGLYGHIFEEPFKIVPGRNEVVFPFKKGEGKLYLLIFNQTNAFGLRELNYSFNGFESDSEDSLGEFENESGSNRGNDNEVNVENSKANSNQLLELSNLLSGSGSALLGSEMTNLGLTNYPNFTIDWENSSDKKVSLVTGNVVSNKQLEPNDILLGILGIGTFSVLSYGLYRLSVK